MLGMHLPDPWNALTDASASPSGSKAVIQA